MEQGVSTTNNFKLPSWDGRKTGQTVVVVLILGLLGYAAFLLLPIIATIVWNLVSIAIGAAILIPLAFILFSKKFWRGMNYLTQAISRKYLNWVIEQNPYEILLEQVEAEGKDTEKIKENGDALRGQSAKLTTDIASYNKKMTTAAAEMQVIQRKKAKGSTDPNDDDDYSTFNNTYVNSKEYIDKVQPILNGINIMAAYCDRAYKKAQVELANSKSTIEIMRDSDNAVTVGNKAMQSALAAFKGRPDLNADADQALNSIRTRVANQIGQMKSAIDITSEVMRHIDIRDAAKVQMAADSVLKIQQDPSYNYVDSIKGNNLQLDPKQVASSNANQYLDYFDVKK